MLLTSTRRRAVTFVLKSSLSRVVSKAAHRTQRMPVVQCPASLSSPASLSRPRLPQGDRNAPGWHSLAVTLERVGLLQTLLAFKSADAEDGSE